MLSLLSCQKQADGNATSNPDENKIELVNNEWPKFTTPVDEAKSAVERYASLMDQYDSALVNSNMAVLLNSPLKSFTIRSIDLIEAMGMKMKYERKAKYEYVRVYIGLDEDNQFKLFLTPVEGADLDAHPPKAGRDHILHKDKVKDADGNWTEGDGYVMDFAKPCPNTCPDDILFN